MEEMAAKQACIELVARYAIAVNTRDIEGFVRLFTVDGQWDRPGGHSMHGREEIRAFIDYALPDPTMRTLRHVNGAVLVEIVDENTATTWSQTTVYDTAKGGGLPAPLAGPDQVVEYRDRMVRRDDSWLIALRDTTVVFSASQVLRPPTPSPDDESPRTQIDNRDGDVDRLDKGDG
jgi:uncharacterized protein (TIGR02246 family)